ncbi:MAG: acetate kinase [Lachnospiraceae bacterium]|nr:acetate kinase [Lachnospiraceae bacterium]
MNVLVINCGSSSLKYQLIDTINETVLAKGICERIGIEGSRLVYQPQGQDKMVIEAPMPTHRQAVSLVLSYLVHESHGVIKSLEEVNAVGHRLVHGGEKFADSVLIDDEVIAGVDECSELAPLHNPANLIGVNACRELMPNTPMVGVFDTAFHQTMPEKAYLYGIPYHYYRDYHVRKYGFHGTSHEFVSARMAEFAGLDLNNSKIIVCHLGNGASICAVENGKSVDTSMGMTPLEGLVMGNRSGDIDPAVLEFIGEKDGISFKETLDLLNKKSGVFGLSEDLSSDFRDLEQAAEEGNEAAIRARAVFNYRCAKYIGSYVAAMNGVDAIAFTAGLGENDWLVRRDVCSYLGYLGITIDPEANRARGKDTMISTPDSKVKVALIATNEELAIAKKTLAVLSK